VTNRLPKKQFGAIPVNAISDKRLSATDWRVLSAIARSDAFGKNGRHCYACQQTIANWAATDRTSANKSIHRLVEWGYIVKQPLKDRYEYAVIYSNCDESDTHDKAGCVEKNTSGVSTSPHINKEPKYTSLNSEIDSPKVRPPETRAHLISNPQGRLAKIERDSVERGYVSESEETELAEIEDLALGETPQLGMALEAQIERIRWRLDT
jgi:predicted transcriptional regulator